MQWCKSLALRPNSAAMCTKALVNNLLFQKSWGMYNIISWFYYLCYRVDAYHHRSVKRTTCGFKADHEVIGYFYLDVLSCFQFYRLQYSNKLWKVGQFRSVRAEWNVRLCGSMPLSLSLRVAVLGHGLESRCPWPWHAWPWRWLWHWWPR